MANIRFLFTNRYGAATTVVTASSAASGLPAAASQNPDRTYVWRSLTQTGVQTLDIDLGSVLAVASVAVANVKLVGIGVLEFYHRGDAGSPGAATLVATLPTQDRDTRVAVAFFGSQSHRHWQLKWTNPGVHNDYAELGYAFLGTYLEPAINVKVPFSSPRQDPSIGTPSVDGQKTFVRRTKFFAGAWEFDHVTEAVLDTLRAFFDAIGVSTPHFVVLDTALSWTAYYARLTGSLGLRPEFAPGRTTSSIAWEEVR